MLNVVIIDDEALVRVGLKSMINWEDNGFQIIGEASNGQQGIEIINKYKPDIIITDIKMPIMDGLEMIKSVCESCPKSKFIILSSYDEFALVKQSMKLGVVEYLIKLELEPETLINVLNQARNKIFAEQQESERKNMLEMHVRVNKPVFREGFFKKLFAGVVREKNEIYENLRVLEIELNEERLVCAFIKVEESNNDNKFGKEDMQLFDFSVINIMDEIMNDAFISYSFKWNMKDYVIVFSLEPDWDEEFFRKKLSETSERLIQMLKQYFSLSVTIGISSIHGGFDNLGKAFLESSKALQYGFYKGSDSFIYYDECLLKEINDENFKLDNYLDRLKRSMELFDKSDIHNVFYEIIYELGKKNYTREKSLDLCCQIAYHVSSILGNEEALSSAMGNNTSLFAEISKQNSIFDLIKWLESFQEVLINILENSQDHQNNRLIIKAKKYINQNTKKEITLNEVAGLLGLSPGYFSTLFKQVTGKNFIDYVAEVKIDYAKKLLMDTNLKIYEVSETVGFENAYYFSRVFKKITGMTPTEYISKES